MALYQQETSVEQVAPNRWRGRVHGSWNIGENPNGGYLASIALRAMGQLTPDQPYPLSATIHYLRTGLSDQPCEIVAELVKPGRTLSVVRGTLLQEGKPRLEVLAAFGMLASESHSPELNIPKPDMPGPDKCIQRSGDQQGVGLPLLDRLDIRLHPDQALAGAAGRAEVSGWIRLRDQVEPDPLSPVLFADAFPPSVFGLLGAVGWVPTLELTVHVRRPLSPGWVLGAMTTSDLMNGQMIENGCLWDEQGRVIAQSRQLALVMSRGDQ